MLQRTILVLLCILGLANCTTAPKQHASRSSPLTGEGVDFATLFDELVTAQRSEPTTKPIKEDPESVIKYESVDELEKLAASKDCQSATEDEPATAQCASISAAQQTMTERRNDGCSKRHYCTLRGTLRDFAITCRTCMTCCDVRNGQTTCKTSCTGPYPIVMSLDA